MIKAVLTDLEGTITRFAFVKYVLYPYAKENLPDYIDYYQYNPEVKKQLDAVRWGIEEPEAGVDRVTEVLVHWLMNDEKVPALNELLGMIWKSGYEQDDFKGHIYLDAFHFLRKLNKYKQDLFVFSASPVKAQHLFFQNSDFGDISEWFKGYFDTTIGRKNSAHTYAEILKGLPYRPEEILFLSDVKAELDAAMSQGIKTCQLVRDGQETSQVHPWIHDMEEFPWRLLRS